jgi:hypothetical protein
LKILWIGQMYPFHQLLQAGISLVQL